MLRLAALAAFLVVAPAARADGPSQRVLTNGLTVVVDRVPGAPGVAAIVAAGAGSSDDTPRGGLAHYLEHILFKGTRRYAPTETHRTVESHGGEFNAFTGQDYTAYWIEIPKEHLSIALDVLAEATLRPTFPPEEVEKERTVILEEWRRRADSPEYLRWDRLGAAAFRTHPYGWPGVGTETSIRAITREEMIAFHDLYYRPRNMILVVSGDVSPDSVFALAGSLFDAPDRPAPVRARTPEIPWEEPRRIFEEAPAGRAYWALACLGPSAAREPEANAALDLAAGTLAGGDASPLHRRLVDDLRIADGVGAWWSTSRDSYLFVVVGLSEPVDLPLVEREARRALARLAVEPPDPEEVDRARAQAEASWAQGTESPRARAFRLAFFWGAQDLGEYDRYLDRIRRIEPEEIRRAAEDLDSPNALFFAIIPPAAGAAMGETRVVLPNGMRILLRPDAAAPVASFILDVAAGQVEEEVPGSAPLLASLLAKGAGGRTSEELARAWEGAGLSVGASSEADLTAITASGPPEVAGLALRAVADLALAADLPPGEVEAARERTLREIAAKADDPFAFAYDGLRAIALPGPYARPVEGDETSVRAISRADLFSYYRKNFVPSRFTLAVEGNFDPAAVLASVRRRYGGLDAGSPRRAGAEEFGDGARPREATRTIERPGAAQALLLVAWPADPVGDADYPALKIANALLGGASQARLFRHLREESGLAYEIGSFYPTRRGPSLLIAYLGTDPANLASDSPSLLMAVRGVLERLRDELTPEELEAARAKVLGDFLLDHQTSARRAWYRAWFETVGAGADYDEGYPEAIRSVTIDDARRAVERLLASPPHVLRLVPAPAAGE